MVFSDGILQLLADKSDKYIATDLQEHSANDDAKQSGEVSLAFLWHRLCFSR